MVTEKIETAYSGFKLNGFVALILYIAGIAASIASIIYGGINEYGLIIGGGITLLHYDFR